MAISIGEPSVLTRLPRSNIENGRSLFAQVHGLRNGLKRKRQEICAAIDGNSLNIYEVNGGKHTSSYPIPPDTSFECPPCSLRHKDENGKAARRTYSVTKRRNRRQLQCFKETAVELSAPSISKISQPLQSSTSTVHIETLHQANNNSIAVFGIDGSFEIFNIDLSLKLASGRLDKTDNNAECVVIQCVSSTEASRSILKSRPDITAAAGRDVTYAVAIFRDISSDKELESVQYGVWALPYNKDKHEDVQPLIYQTLTVPTTHLVRGPISAKFTARGSQLLIRSTNQTLTYNLSTITPTLTDTQPNLPTSQISDLVLSDHLVLCTTSNSIQLYNTRFRALQAVYELGKPGLKRQRGSQHTGSVSLIAYFPQSHRAIAVRRTSLLAIDLQSSQNNDLSHAIRQGSMLASNIGKGAQDPEVRSVQPTKIRRTKIGTIHSLSFSHEGWTELRSKLEDCLAKADTNSFETIFLEYVSPHSNSEVTESLNQHSASAVSYVLSKIFRYATKTENVADTGTPNLQIGISVPRTIVWLAREAHLSIDRIKQALLATHDAHSLQGLEMDSLAEALLDADPSFSLTMDVLENMPIISAGDLCATVKALIRRALSQSNQLASRNDNIGHNITSSPEDNKALTVFKDTNTSVTSRSLNIDSALTVALERLATFEHRVISTNLSTILGQQDLVALVQFLRQQLFRSGYTRSMHSQAYPSPPPSLNGVLKEGEAPLVDKNELTLTAIVTVLSGCIDVLGPFGLISSGDAMQFIQTLIPELSSEITRAMEGLSESTYILGILRETLRFSESIHKDISHELISSKDKSSNTGARITTVYAEHLADGDLSSGLTALPLSLKGEARINDRKVRKGNGKVLGRSKREQGVLLDRLRPPYVLERLEL